MVGVAIVAMIIATLAHHMGLPEAIMKVASKIARCPKCLSFWVTFAVLILYNCDLIVAIALSVVVAYISYYIELIFDILHDIYNWIWERKQRWLKRKPRSK